MEKHHHIYRTERFPKNRIEAFSDGVFAIVITLLVLELKVPHIPEGASQAEFFTELAHVWPKFLSWVISFLVVGVIWQNHHRLLDNFRTLDNGLFWHNLHLLFWMCFVPFPTALMGDYPESALALSFFGVASSMMGLAFLLFRLYAHRRPHLFKAEVDIDYFKKGTGRVLFFGPTLYLIGAALAWVRPSWAFAIYLFIPLYFMFPTTNQILLKDDN